MKKIDTEKVNFYTQRYYCKLHTMVDGILKNFGGISNKDIDDFYSLGNEVFVLAANTYNGQGEFCGFLRLCLQKKIKSMISQRNRQKRSHVEVVHHPDGTIEKVYHPILSVDSIVEGENGDTFVTLGEIIPSKFDLNDELSKEMGTLFGGKADEYLDKLPETQRHIVLLLRDGYVASEIKKILHINEKEYADQMLGIRANENVSVLF